MTIRLISGHEKISRIRDYRRLNDNLVDFGTGIDTLYFYKRPVYKRHEPEICQNFRNRIGECPGWDSALAISENNFIRIFHLKNDFDSNFSEI